MDGNWKGKMDGWMKVWDNLNVSASASGGDGIHLQVCVTF